MQSSNCKKGKIVQQPASAMALCNCIVGTIVMHERTHHQTDASLICFFVCILCMIGETGSTQEQSNLWEFSQTGDVLCVFMISIC